MLEWLSEKKYRRAMIGIARGFCRLGGQSSRTL
jgi:allophanate hydrolase subunit 1